MVRHIKAPEEESGSFANRGDCLGRDICNKPKLTDSTKTIRATLRSLTETPSAGGSIGEAMRLTDIIGKGEP